MKICHHLTISDFVLMNEYEFTRSSVHLAILYDRLRFKRDEIINVHEYIGNIFVETTKPSFKLSKN